ncbi:MAG: hypothetical protein JWM48_53 [Mycobacterium sp.]|nr:hypothetical protein [Mycobacterium sp.]
MIEYSTLIQTVGSLVAAADSDETQRAVKAVITAVASGLDEAERHQLAAAVPGAFRDAADVRGPTAQIDSDGALVRLVSDGTGCPQERARFYAQAVLSTLAEAEPELIRTIAQRLPVSEDLFEPIDQGVPPRGSGVPIRLTPRLLDPDEVTRELHRLPGWEGDEHRLRRTVVLPPDRVRPLRDAVARAEREMTHHAQVEQEDGTVTFEVWTHSLNRVTDLDVELARRINAAVDRVGSHG